MELAHKQGILTAASLMVAATAAADAMTDLIRLALLDTTRGRAQGTRAKRAGRR